MPREWSQTALFPSFRCPASLFVCVWLHCQGLPPPPLLPSSPLELCGFGTPFWPGVNLLISNIGSGRRTTREGALAEETPLKMRVNVQPAWSSARTLFLQVVHVPGARYHGEGEKERRGGGRGGRAAARSSRRGFGRSELLQPGGSAGPGRGLPGPPASHQPRLPLCRERRTQTSKGAGACSAPGQKPHICAGLPRLPAAARERLDHKELIKGCRVLRA